MVRGWNGSAAHPHSDFRCGSQNGYGWKKLASFGDDGRALGWRHAVKLPEGWGVWLLALALNALAAGLWFVNRGMERPEAGGSLWALIRSLGTGSMG